MLPSFLHRVFIVAAGVMVLAALLAAPPSPAGEPQHPLPAAPLRALPSLDRSDALVRESVKKARGADALAPFVERDGIIRRFVANVDSVAGGSDAACPEAIAALAALDEKAALALYSRWYPLLQQAYGERSTTPAYFNDRLVEAIDRVLACDPPCEEAAASKLRGVRKRLALRAPGG